MSKGIRPAPNGTDPEVVCQTDHQPTATRTCNKCSTDKPLEAFANDIDELLIRVFRALRATEVAS
jgi:hypothetical protein